MLKREMEELSIRRVTGRNAAMQRKFMALADRWIVHVNGQTFGERTLPAAEVCIAEHGR
jgi:hypothetical protein